MSVRRLLVSLCAVALSTSASSALWAASRGTSSIQPDNRPDFARVIVRFKSDASSVRAQPLAARATAFEARDIARTRGVALGLRANATLTSRLSLDSRTHVYTATGLSSAALARRLAADAEVESVEVDRWARHYAVPNDPLYATAAAVTAGQWYLKAPDSTLVSAINAPAAWDRATGSGVVVAVLDTGLRMDHPDLAGQYVQGYDLVGYSNSGSTAVAAANDGDLADSDPSDPGDWVSQSDIDTGRLGTSCTADDIGPSSWHGTRVAGLIAAATNNGLGMAGLAYGAKVEPIRVLGKCGGWASDIAAGMRWAAGLTVPGLPANANKAKVINLSLGGDGACSNTYQSAINEAVAAGVTVVVAAGNGVDETNNSGGIAVGSPANCSNVIAVTAVRHAGTKVGFSNLGPEATIAAPGGNCVNTTGACLYPILSTSNSGTQTPVPSDNAYNYLGTGTSFATPLVSATVALMLSAKPTATVAELKAALTGSARAFPTTGAQSTTAAQCVNPATLSGKAQDECYCTTSTCGAGMLDADAAVRAITATSSGSGSSGSGSGGGTGTGTGTTTTDTSSGGGGGAMSALWLGALALAAVLLRWPAPRRARIRRDERASRDR